MKKTFFILILFCLGKIFVYAQSVNDHIDLCKKYMMEKKYSEVLNECKVLFQDDLDSVNTASTYAFAGLANKELGNTDDAVTCLKTAIAYKVPQYDVYEIFISMTKDANDASNYEFGLIQEAKAFPDLAYLVEPKLINHYVKTKQYEKLVACSQKILEKDSTNVEYLYYTAYGYQNLNKIEEAEKYYQSVLEIDPDYKKANLSLGSLYYKRATNEYNIEKKKYEKIKNPSRLDYDQYRKNLENSKETYKKALPYLLKVYNQNPSSNLKGIIGNIYSRLGEKEKASQYK